MTEEKSILERVEELLSEITLPVRTDWADTEGNLVNLVPDLLAEARRLEDRVTQLKMDCDQQHKHAMEWQEEAAKWRRIAIDRHAALLYTNDYTELAGKTNIWEKLDRGNQNEYRKEAARELETEATRRGPNEEKISASELDARWRYWQELAIKYRNLLPDGPLGDGPYIELTPERRAALEALSSMQTEITCPECGAWMGFDDIKPHMAALRAMLAEGCIKICECGMNLEYQALAELEHVLSEFRKARP